MKFSISLSAKPKKPPPPITKEAAKPKQIVFKTADAARAAIAKATPELKRLEAEIAKLALQRSMQQRILEVAALALSTKHAETVAEVKKFIAENKVTFGVVKNGSSKRLKYPDLHTALTNAVKEGDKVFEVIDNEPNLLCTIMAVKGKLPKQYAPKWTADGKTYAPLLGAPKRS